MSEKAFLDMLEKSDAITPKFIPTSFTLAPTNASLYARRHSAHSYSTTEQTTASVSKCKSLSIIKLRVHSRCIPKCFGAKRKMV